MKISSDEELDIIKGIYKDGYIMTQYADKKPIIMEKIRIDPSMNWPLLICVSCSILSVLNSLFGMFNF